MTPLIEFEVLGLPAAQGSKSAVVRGGKAVVIEGRRGSGRAKHRAWREAVANAARDVAADRPHDGALHLDIEFRFPLPKSRPAAARAAGRWPHTVRPDVDKCLRSTLDGLTDGGLIVDDARVCAVAIDAWEVAGWTGAVIRLSVLDLPGTLTEAAS